MLLMYHVKQKLSFIKIEPPLQDIIDTFQTILMQVFDASRHYISVYLFHRDFSS